MKIIDGGILAAKGFSVASCATGVKRTKVDMTLLVSDIPAEVAGAFTTNVVRAAPVDYDSAVLKKGKPIRAILVNSGNANACTGKVGIEDVHTSASMTAEELGCLSDEVMICSTGVIGVPLEMEKIEKGIRYCSRNLSCEKDKAHESALAILTTDTFAKEVAVEVTVADKSVRIGGMAKGSGMIHPNMATMLSFITTDANVDRTYLQSLLGSSISTSYNMISVDGDTSTNDTVLVMANGTAGSPLIDADSEFEEVFREAFTYVHTELAKMIVKDGEGASKFVEVSVTGAKSDEDASLLARSVVSSSLVKAAFFGADANWGRILCAMGYSGASFDPSKVTMRYRSEKGKIVVVEEGTPLNFDEELAKKILGENVINLDIILEDGSSEAMSWGCDLSYEYVRINGDYRS
ncbi:MAG: bifunctional ornithine acetyltransferase/N-acetylglutamate synthase [Sphaerochaetaceae bacterium]